MAGRLLRAGAWAILALSVIYLVRVANAHLTDLPPLQLSGASVAAIGLSVGIYVAAVSV